MARKVRVEYAGAIHFVSTHGKGRRDLFSGSRDYAYFLQTLGKACAKTGWQVHAYCLAPRALYLVIETPRANLVAGMRWLMSTYIGHFNRHHDLSGHQVSGRYKSVFVDGRGKGYLKTVCDYVHLRPAHAGWLGRKQDLGAYRWSSLAEYLAVPGRRPSWLKVDSLLAQHGIAGDNAAGRKAFGQAMEALRATAAPADYRRVEWGWCLGSEAFRSNLLARMKPRAQKRSAVTQQKSAAQAANRIIREELKRLRWRESTLVQRRKGDPRKVKLALRLRRETTVTTAWIARRLHMGGMTSLAHLLWLAGRNR